MDKLNQTDSIVIYQTTDGETFALLAELCRKVQKKSHSFGMTLDFKKWCHQESNRGHKAINRQCQSFALLAELCRKV